MGTWTEQACKIIGNTGCCKGEVLWWCASGGQLESRHCTAWGAPHCGWSSAGKKYDCNTAGASDPSGKYDQQCMLAAENAWLPDAGGPANTCGGITNEGCCAGNVLKYCDGGKLEVMDCALNPTCGWLANGQQYDCGTAGKSDPRGTHKKTCPGATPVDGVPDVGRDSMDNGADSEVASENDDGCGCGISTGPAGSWALLALLFLAARRRSSYRRALSGRKITAPPKR